LISLVSLLSTFIFQIKRPKIYKMPRLPYHLVDLRPWPITSAMRAIFIVLGIINWFHYSRTRILLLGTTITTISMFLWWRDIVREATFIGKHTSYVQNNLKIGIILFIIREVCFFFAFFWAFFHRSLTPSIEIGCTWPPIGIITINPIGVPLLNTMVLLSSGLTVTWSHHCLLSKKRTIAAISILITITLGLYFTYLQIIEYNQAPFTIADGIYGSIFYVTTGFHGAHVIIGTSFLLVNLLRIIKAHFSRSHHVGLETATWYWHFVDVVWICLYICIYWWGSLWYSVPLAQ